jgi:hypothetical protein
VVKSIPVSFLRIFLFDNLRLLIMYKGDTYYPVTAVLTA